MLAVAATDKQIQPLWEKISTQLNWLNLNTQGGYKQLRQVKNSEADMWKRASMKTKDGEEHGSMSQIKGLVANNPRNVRGYRCHRLFYEESGSNPVLKTSWVQGEALVVRVGRKTGTRFAWGENSVPSYSGKNK